MNALLKFITCGSVDDGKSTLIGHMLYDAKLLFADQERALELDSKVGSRGGEIDLAVILVDASQGVLTQTRRHTRICSLMGIKHFVFAVNKMDLIDFEQEKFQKIQKDIKVLLAEFEYSTAQMIPVSATEGDNITKRSVHMPWYTGKTLLDYLETINVKENPAETGFTMPVQRVCRPNHTFRGFQGQIESGSVSVGDAIKVLPSGESAKVTLIYEGDKEVQTSATGHAVTIQLDTEIDVSRGCVLIRDTSLNVNSMFAATLLWMDDVKLLPGRNFLLKLGTQSVPATIMKIRYKIDVNTGEEVYADAIYKNEIALCEISTASKLVFDEFEKNNALGSLILIDRVSHMTSACGIVEHTLNRENQLTWHNMDITRSFREEQLGQTAKTIWFTGLSGSGKSTLANELEKRLAAMGKHTMLLDGDNVRMGLNRNLGFREADRIENIRRIAEVSKLMNDAGLIVLTSFISPFAQDRQNAREIIGDAFMEVYVSTPMEECERRDVKGLYKKARNGELDHFTGVTSPYEVPQHADVVIDTSKFSVEACVDQILEQLKNQL